MTHVRVPLLLLIGVIAVAVGCGCTSTTTPDSSGKSTSGDSKGSVTLLNVSYDPTRELYQDFNTAFAKHWLQEHGQSVTVEQSHGGSGKQARAVIDGLEADVVTLALAYDIDVIAEKGQLLDAKWQERLPANSSPYTSTIVFLVRKGNPKQIKDWDDLLKGDVSIVTPNPKTSGGARWNYLAAWGHAVKKELGDLSKVKDASPEQLKAANAKAKEFVAQLYKRVPVLDSGARGSTNTFVQREIGDVLLAWENEAYLAVKDLGPDKVEIVVPSVSILAEPPVSVVDKVAEKRGTAEVAKAYLEYLYTPEGQTIVAKHYYRPAKPESVPADALSQFQKVELFSINDVFGGWSKAQKEHFDDGGVFDQIYAPAAK